MKWNLDVLINSTAKNHRRNKVITHSILAVFGIITVIFTLILFPYPAFTLDIEETDESTTPEFITEEPTTTAEPTTPEPITEPTTTEEFSTAPPKTTEEPIPEITTPTTAPTTTEEPTTTQEPVTELYYVIKDEDTGIMVKAGVDIFPSDTIFVVTPVTAGTEFTVIDYALTEISDDFVAFDLSFFLYGIEIQPKDIVTVTIPIPEEFDFNDICLFHLLKDGTLNEVQFVLSDDKKFLIFEAGSFSIYAIARLKNKSQPIIIIEDYDIPGNPASFEDDTISETSEPPISNPATGGNYTVLIVAIGILLISGGISGFIVKNKNY